MSTRTRRRFFASGIALTILLALGSLQAASKKAPPKPAADECLTCHSDSTLSHEENGKTVSLHVDPDKFKDSIHGSMFTCVDCHTDVKSAAHETTPKKISCATCHADEQAAYEKSFHGKAVQAGNGHAATCVDCHGSPHELLPGSDPKSRVAHVNIPATCGSCHGQQFVMEKDGLRAQMVASYQQSVHGHAVANGSEKAAVCTDCHGRARHPRCERSQVAHLQVQRPANLRQVPRADLQRVSAEHSRNCHCARQLAGSSLHRLPRHSLHQGTHGSEFSCVGTKRRASYVRKVPRGSTSLTGVRSSRTPCHNISRELSRPCVASRIASRRQLRELPRHAQHLPIERPAVHDSPFEPGAHVRPMPSGRNRKIHRRQGSRRCSALGRHRQ